MLFTTRNKHGLLQSEIDVLNSMVAMLKTSTGELQSEIDVIMPSNQISRIQVLETCCAMLKTSTGFLQSIRCVLFATRNKHGHASK